MKILNKIVALIIVTLMTFILTRNTQVNTFASLNLDTSNRKVVNVAVLLKNFDDPFLLKLKQGLEDIEKENTSKVKFTFYNGESNIAIQTETLDSISQRNTDLIMAFLQDTREDTVKNVLSKSKEKKIPLIIMDVDPNVALRVSNDYDKVAFILPISNQAGIIQGKILINLWNTNKNLIDKNSDNILQYVLLQGTVNTPIATERTKYVISTLNSSGIKTEQLALVNTIWDRNLAKVSIENLFLKYDGKIEAIIANNDALAIGAIEALQKYGYNKGDKSKYITVVGIDGIQEAKDLVDKGFMAGTVIEDTTSFAKDLYTIGLNLINNVSPIENTNYKYSDAEIIIPFSYQEYTGKTNTP